MKFKLLNALTQNSRFNAVLVFFITYFVYLLTIYPNVATEDAGELIGAAALPDIGHPPGYPLHTIIGWILTKIIFFGNIAWRVNLLSAVFASLTAAVLYLLLKRLTKNDLVAFAGAIFLAFTDIFWAQTVRAEIYTLSAFFFILISYVLLIWEEKQEERYLLWVAFLYGLSWTNSYMIMALTAPPIIIYVLAKNWRLILNIPLILKCIGLFFVGLIPYAYMPLRTYLAPYTNPAFIDHNGLHTWDTFINFVNRKIYGGTAEMFFTTPIQKISQPDPVLAFFQGTGFYIYNFAKRYIDGNMKGFLLMGKIIIEQLVYLPILFFVPGIIQTFKTTKKYWIYIFACFFFYTIFQLGHIQIYQGMHPFTAESNRPFYISAILITGIICFNGVEMLRTWLEPRTRKYLLFGLVAILPLLPLGVNFYNSNESHNYLAYDFNKNVLRSLPQNAYLLSIGRDNSTFPLYYIQKIENFRTDVKVNIYYYGQSPSKNYLDSILRENNLDYLFIDLLPWNYGGTGIVPYNFVYVYGKNIPAQVANLDQFPVRGIRKEMDYNNTKVKALYYLKAALITLNPEERAYYLKKVVDECGIMSQYVAVATDIVNGKFAVGMF